MPIALWTTSGKSFDAVAVIKGSVWSAGRHATDSARHIECSLELPRFGGAWEAFPGGQADAEDAPTVFT
jgi:hypothetical protein